MKFIEDACYIICMYLKYFVKLGFIKNVNLILLYNKFIISVKTVLGKIHTWNRYYSSVKRR
jgi:hypothetical protein